MSRRAGLLSLAGLAVAFALGILVAVGPSLPGPPVRDWLGFADQPLPDLCQLDPEEIVEPPGNPGPGRWVPEPDSPTPSPEAGAATLGGYVYMVGGQLRAGTEPTVLRFDPRSGEYQTNPEAPVAIDHPVVASHGRELILASGYVDGAVSTSRAWSYTPRRRGWRELPSMSKPRGAAAGAVIGDQLFVTGGVSEFGNEYEPYDDLEIYDFKTREWSAGPEMPTPRHHHGAAAVDGKLYVVGGRQPRDQSLAEFEMFDPERDRWYPLPPLPVGSGAPGVTAVGGRVIVTGGGDDPLRPGEGGTVLRSAFSFDPETRKWSRLPDMRQARHGHVAAAVDGSVYVFRGTPCPGYGQMDSVESLSVTEGPR